jgi:hypothetical protein
MLDKIMIQENKTPVIGSYQRRIKSLKDMHRWLPSKFSHCLYHIWRKLQKNTSLATTIQRNERE